MNTAKITDSILLTNDIFIFTHFYRLRFSPATLNLGTLHVQVHDKHEPLLNVLAIWRQLQTDATGPGPMSTVCFCGWILIKSNLPCFRESFYTVIGDGVDAGTHLRAMYVFCGLILSNICVLKSTAVLFNCRPPRHTQLIGPNSVNGHKGKSLFVCHLLYWVNYWQTIAQT